MINVFIPIVENVEAFSEFISKHNESSTRIYVGITEDLKEKLKVANENVEIHIFKSKTKKEDMLNSLQKVKRQKGGLLVIRRPLTDEEFQKLTTSSAEISTLKAHHNKFVTWIKNITRKIIKKVFAFNYFEDISAIFYSEFLHELICACPNLSMASRINKYVGVEVEEIETTLPSVKKDYSRLKNALVLTLGLFVLLATIAGTTCVFVFVNRIRALYVVLVIAMLFVALTIFALLLLNFTRTLAVGSLESTAPQEIEVINAKIDEVVVEKTRKKATEKKTTKKVSKTAKSVKDSSKTKSTTSKTKKGALGEQIDETVEEVKSESSSKVKPKTSNSTKKVTSKKATTEKSPSQTSTASKKQTKQAKTKTIKE